jgi:hypothetical protein
MSISESIIPSILNPSDEFLTRKYRHKAAITKGKKVLSYGECSIGGCRHITKTFGVSCHAEINALKPFIYNQIKGR